MDAPARRIEMLFYAGYKGEETPRAIVVDGRVHPVEAVLSRTRGLRNDTGTTFEIFRVRIAGRTVVIRRSDSGETELLNAGDLSFLS
jgi:hypothetical protein